MIRILINTSEHDVHILDMNNLLVSAGSSVNGLIFGDQVLRESANAQALMLQGILSISDGTSIYQGKQAVDFLNGYSVQTTKDGKPIFTASDRPKDHYRCYASRGDDVVAKIIGQGVPLVFEVAPEATQTIDARFVDDIYLRDGKCLYELAELGSYCTITVICPAGYPFPNPAGTGQYDIGASGVVVNAEHKGKYDIAGTETTVFRFLHEALLFGAVGEFSLETPEPFQLKKPYFLRIAVHNAGNQNVLKAVVNMGLYRTRTV